ncbi:MAG: nucleotidyl transferase AbiEii/AbiGii toxin family protein [Actinobacteria bacterium]|nr:nucleotidyl transferase AbiEii/AbiGii toxin family protein [Actinomycetota bacterium]
MNMAFVGGTALRFLFFLPRYSEDMDFSVLPSKEINFKDLLHRLKINFEAENYKIIIKKGKQKTVMGAFIRFNALLYELGLSPHKDEVLSVKLEIDTNPPEGAVTAVTLIRRYVTVNILHYDKASLFAGKINAILTRKYTKGRDLFDLVWTLADSSWSLPNFILLNNALYQTKWAGLKINSGNWKSILAEHIKNINWERVVEDVSPFLERESDRSLLTKENCKRLINKFH